MQMIRVVMLILLSWMVPHVVMKVLADPTIEVVDKVRVASVKPLGINFQVEGALKRSVEINFEGIAHRVCIEGALIHRDALGTGYSGGRHIFVGPWCQEQHRRRRGHDQRYVRDGKEL